MNVYDFDGTIYQGDSSVDFYLFCLTRHWHIISYLPTQLFALLCYRFRLITKKACKEGFFTFLRGLESPKAEAVEFWERNRKKIYTWYLEQQHPDDVVISASPEFLLVPICADLGIKHLIATRVSSDGSIFGANCHGEEKSNRFREVFGDVQIEQFYSDSLSDLPMAKLSQSPYFVRNGKRRKWFFDITESPDGNSQDSHV